MIIFPALFAWYVHTIFIYHRVVIKRVTVKTRCGVPAVLSPPARLSIQKSCASPASVEPHNIALARRADIKDRKSLFTGNLSQVQPCTSYISPQLRSNSSVPTRRKAGSDLVVNKKAFGRAKRTAHARGTILVNLIVAPIEEEGIVYGSQIDLLRN